MPSPGNTQFAFTLVTDLEETTRSLISGEGDPIVLQKGFVQAVAEVDSSVTPKGGKFIDPRSVPTNTFDQILKNSDLLRNPTPDPEEKSAVFAEFSSRADAVDAREAFVRGLSEEQKIAYGAGTAKFELKILELEPDPT